MACKTQPVPINVESREDAEAALIQIAQLDLQEESVRAELNEALRELNESYQDRLCVTVAGHTIAIDVRRKALYDAIMAWADKHRAELCPTEVKTCELRNGKIFWKLTKDAVGYQEEMDHKSACEKIGARDGLIGRLEALIDELELHGIVTVALKISLAAALAAHKKQKVDAATLKRLGLRFLPGEEFIHVEPAKLARE